MKSRDKRRTTHSVVVEQDRKFDGLRNVTSVTSFANWEPKVIIESRLLRARNNDLGYEDARVLLAQEPPRPLCCILCRCGSR
jgi:hypothetical protein